MFYYLNGELAYRDINTCVIDCGGVGYKMTTSVITSEALASKLGKQVKLFTHLAVREDAIELFGFGSNEEKECFNHLIGVSGIGPKAAMSILSTCGKIQDIFDIEGGRLFTRKELVTVKTWNKSYLHKHVSKKKQVPNIMHSKSTVLNRP